jgi:glycine/D-amino acid oxidase-like deaminating enzyme
MRDGSEGRRALVVGLGIAGLATALRLHQIGWTPVIVERAAFRQGMARLRQIPWAKPLFARIAEGSKVGELKDRDIAAPGAMRGVDDAARAVATCPR